MTPTLTEQKAQILEAFRRWGYLEADLDPLGWLPRHAHPDLDHKGEDAEAARKFYCGTVSAEFAHIPDPERRRWIESRMEVDPAPIPTAQQRERILERLISAETFEQFMQARYPGMKRFSLEGTVSLVPLLDEVLESAAEHGAEEAILGMSHRGRLNVMYHIVGREAAELFAGFEDVDPRSLMGGGDVKYHRGATGFFNTRSGARVNIHLVSNPSHLEAVDPVVAGRAYAKQIRRGAFGAKQVLPIVMHGDGAFAGQGIWAETLNLGSLEGYNVGGTIHVIINNLIAFTTPPWELQSTAFASDLAKRAAIPILHVNGEDPDAVARVGRMAGEYRATFGSDVVVDLIGYRRHGHSEVDDPTITQPVLYRKIKDHPPVWRGYAEKTQIDSAAILARIREGLDAAQKSAEQFQKNPTLRQLPPYWDEFFGGKYKPEYEVPTGVPAETLRAITAAITSYPPGFAIHPKAKKLLEQRVEMLRGDRMVDYGMAEALAFGSLLRQGIPLRLTGQDTRRGTFNHRHAALVDTETEQEFVPLQHVDAAQARCEIYNTSLSEAGVLGFEYGFSRDYPEALVLWEAQFGDFANGAQVIIDQFIAAAEDKWGLLSGLVMLLPHGYEGQGPEHSSARIERYLHLAARDNFQICQPSDAAQYFHLLRRQALRKWRKPLVVFTPKSMLRHPDSASPIEAFSRSHFRSVLRDGEVQGAQRILVCTGKIGHDLRRERKRIGNTTTAIIFVEQMYPFPEEELVTALAAHPGAHDIVWVQEEPANMGALFFMFPRLQRLARGIPVRSVKRSASASPATGSGKAHELEQQALLSVAFATTGKS